MLTWYGNQKTVTKLMMGFALVGLIMASVGYIGISNMGHINDATENIYNVQLKPILALTGIRGMVHQIRTQTVAAVLTKNTADREAAIAKLREIAKELSEAREAFEKTIVSEGVRTAYKEFGTAYDAYRTYREESIFKPLLKGDQEEALAAMKGEGAVKFKAAMEAANHVVDVKTKIADGKYNDAVKIYSESKLTLSGIIVSGIALGLVFGWLIARFLSRNLADVVMAAQALGGGNLSARSSVATQDEVGTLAQSFNEMGEQLQAKVAKEREQAAKMEAFMVDAKRVLGKLAQGDLTEHMTGACDGDLDQIKASLNAALTNLTTTLTTVRTAAESVSTGAEQITKGNEDLSQRTSEQASALEETSSAMEEMTSTVKQNADNAKQANQLAIAARDVAEKGGAVTTKAIDAMDEINKSSKKIADIITVIDEIAFQTNLLALNAAVEAARAGEHGRGFAVVAAEVRNLAQRSATAAKEIKGLINESVQRVTDGSELVDQCGKTLAEIVGSVKRVTDVIAEITAASQEQASGIDQVNKAIMQMDETTQQNAALVEEATSASQSMKEQAKELMNQVASFQLTQTGQEHSQRPSPAPTAHKPSALSAGPVKKPMSRKPAPSHVPVREPAGVASGNGKDRRQKDNEFEEF